jgi:hypothetical protein
MQNGLELLWVYLFILSSNVQSSDSKTLKIYLFEVLPPHESFIDDSYCYIESLRPHLELIVKLSKPINEVLPIFVGYLRLEVLVCQEIAWIHMAVFFFSHVFHDLWYKLDDCLRISYFQHIVQIKFGLVFSKPVFSPDLHFFYNSLQLFLIKLLEPETLWLSGHYQACWNLYLLNNLV